MAGALKALLLRPERVNPAVERSVTCEVEPGGGALWPPLLPTPASRALSGLVVKVTRDLGWDAEPITRGGASDAAHAAAAGIPAICGLGPVTSGIHADQEHTCVGALRASTLVAATLLSRLDQLDGREPAGSPRLRRDGRSTTGENQPVLPGSVGTPLLASPFPPSRLPFPATPGLRCVIAMKR